MSGEVSHPPWQSRDGAGFGSCSPVELLGNPPCGPPIRIAPLKVLVHHLSWSGHLGGPDGSPETQTAMTPFVCTNREAIYSGANTQHFASPSPKNAANAPTQCLPTLDFKAIHRRSKEM